ncbi:glycoside hydrolase [Paenibacillus sp. CAA11]|uniref:family 43 glycosylhydrolase n=1 Tax=Paenibacillus sp. CAA11 TaxID=1532905 RepID=UPI000D33546A|nr:family 43 glycosylhydrolase [Paenibacillus sp. CAA11]AWB43047.1 glycoside hydrolase [Paenibacillus sp. CAA11]
MRRNFLYVLSVAALSAAVVLPGSVVAGSPNASSSVQQQFIHKAKGLAPVFENASVHDPSVIKVNDTYYVFGSHLAAAKSKDLMKWETIASGVQDGNPLIPNVTTELSEALKWAQSDTLWAPDVIQLKDGKYYMYYNACKGDSPRSAMGIAVADKPEGPYKDMGIFLKSGMWGEASEDGTIYDAAKHPNVVDPHVFFDKNGKLWMVYGSYSGGIFILEMNPETGKPLPNQGYGKKLTGGNHSRSEGPYMLYSPKTDYYYLFLSFGGLDAVGGYNVRVARSKTPDGPFYDAAGNDMLQVKADPAKPLFDDKSIEPYGVKLMGNYLFQRELGDPGTGSGTGYVSPGHNSAYYDEATGKHFLIFHSRFPGRGEEHEIRVHEMYMNSEGWPVVDPYRYSADAPELRKLNKQEIAGEYAWVNHGKEITADIKLSQSVQLSKDGKVSGAVSGTWTLVGDKDIRLTAGGSVYYGVFARSWAPEAGAYVLTFSALSSDGVAVWGSQKPVLKDKEVIAAVKKELTLGDTSNVFYNLQLPREATHGSVISWQSSNPSVVSPEGMVSRPAPGLGDATVELTATIRKGKESDTKRFRLTVQQQASGPLLGQYSFPESGTGLAKDTSGNGYHGQLFGGVTGTPDGKLGAAAVFNGTDSYISLPGLIGDAEDFTFTAWVYWNGGGAWQRIFDFGNGMTKHMFLTPSQHTGVLQFTIHDQGQDQSLLAAEALPSKQWVHVAVTLQGDKGTLYVNGKEAAASDKITYNPKELQVKEAYLGKSRYTADPFFQGKLDEVKVYNKALTPLEIRQQAGLVPASS